MHDKILFQFIVAIDCLYKSLRSAYVEKFQNVSTRKKKTLIKTYKHLKMQKNHNPSAYR